MFYLPLLSTARGLGCFGDTSRRAIPTLEGKSRLLTGSYRSRWDAIRKCASSAYIRGYRVFGVQHGGWCAASRTAFRTYAKYGKSNRCRNGKGGPWANDVYVLKGERHFVWLLPYFQLFSCGLLLHSWGQGKRKRETSCCNSHNIRRPMRRHSIGTGRRKRRQNFARPDLVHDFFVPSSLIVLDFNKRRRQRQR